MSEPLVVCENLVKIYKLNGVEMMALQGLDLTVQPGELLGVVGASGSGKTTLLNMLGGLDRPSAGRVVVGGQDLLQMSETQLDVYRKHKVGFVWQQTTRNLIYYLTALENVMLPQALAGVALGQRRAFAIELLTALGLGERLHHRPAALSGGEQQRVSIAVALANRPSLLLADEPTGELDTATAQDVYAALQQMNEKYNMTTIIVSHDPTISQHTGRVVAIRDGKTSTETVRVKDASRAEAPQPAPQMAEAAPLNPAGNPGERPDERKTHEFEELVVLDTAGRLQIPRDYLEALNIGDRVRLEVKDGQIVVQPVAGRGRTKATVEEEHDKIGLFVEEDLPPEQASGSLAARARRLVGKLRPGRRNEKLAEAAPEGLPGGQAEALPAEEEAAP